MLPNDSTALSGGGIARARSPSFVKQSYYLDCAVVPLSVSLQAMVSPNNGGGTASIPEIQDETLCGSTFEAIGAYKYPNLFYMKGYESVNNIL